MNCGFSAYCKAALDFCQKCSRKNNGRNCRCELHLPGGSQGPRTSLLQCIWEQAAPHLLQLGVKKHPGEAWCYLIALAQHHLVPGSCYMRCHTSTRHYSVEVLFRQKDRGSSVCPMLERGNGGRKYCLPAERPRNCEIPKIPKSHLYL